MSSTTKEWRPSNLLTATQRISASRRQVETVFLTSSTIVLIDFGNLEWLRMLLGVSPTIRIGVEGNKDKLRPSELSGCQIGLGIGEYGVIKILLVATFCGISFKSLAYLSLLLFAFCPFLFLFCFSTLALEERTHHNRAIRAA
ncbi:hypothetical protein ACN42_g4104 [Penicillium freii]|uniref:Uncharacterized protein n=1 Tax=Penicillium freii TaxID=48697 RepID=A0A101MM01_PENFR|nr:hypothetical protein ACN42_g4104 [Penicillium freii]